MGKFRLIKFDSKVLNALKDAPNSRVEVFRTEKHLALHPIQLNDFGKSVEDLLNEDVARYSKELQGILLGYENIKLLRNGGTISYDSCYVHTDIEADFFIFRPKLGDELKGVVTRKSKDHVGVLVYDIFNVSIPCDKEQEHWLGADVQVGYKVSFRIIYFSMKSYMPYIRGQLISIDSKFDNSALPSNGKKKSIKKKIFKEESEDSPETPKNDGKPNKKRRKSVAQDFDDSLQVNPINESLDSSATLTNKKRKKKSKNKDTSLLEELVDQIKEEINVLPDEDIVSETKKKKRKRSLSMMEDLNDENEVGIRGFAFRSWLRTGGVLLIGSQVDVSECLP